MIKIILHEVVVVSEIEHDQVHPSVSTTMVQILGKKLALINEGRFVEGKIHKKTHNHSREECWAQLNCNELTRTALWGDIKVIWELIDRKMKELALEHHISYPEMCR